MTRKIENPFFIFIRGKRRSVPLAQQELAALIGANVGSMSEYLSGKTRMPEKAFLDMCSVLRLTSDESRKAWLMHWLLHTPPVVRAYIEDMEKERMTRDLCDDRLDRLRALTVGMLADRKAAGEWAPLLIEQDEGTSRIGKAVRILPGDDTGDATPPV